MNIIKICFYYLFVYEYNMNITTENNTLRSESVRYNLLLLFLYIRITV